MAWHGHDMLRVNRPLCNYTILPATVNVLKTFLEAISWKSFQLLRRILNYISNTTKNAVPSMLISVEGRGKSQLEPGEESMGNAPVSSHCSLVRNPWPKPTGVLEHCREGDFNCWFSVFWGRVLLTASVRRRRMSVYISLFTVLSSGMKW